MASEKFGELINQVKKRCYITNDEELVQDRLNSIVKNAIPKVKNLLGIYNDEFDFTTQGEENELFLNFCMYRWNNKSQKEFESNYIGDILSIRHQNEVKYAKTKEEEDSNNE